MYAHQDNNKFTRQKGLPSSMTGHLKIQMQIKSPQVSSLLPVKVSDKWYRSKVIRNMYSSFSQKKKKKEERGKYIEREGLL